MPVELPSSPPTTPPTPDQVAEATVQAMLDRQAAESEAKLKASFDIQDPSVKPAAPAPSAPAVSSPAAPATIPGAVADGLTEQLLDRAAAIGINETRARALGADGVRDILSRVRIEPEPAPQPQYKYDPETGKKLQPDPEDDIPELGEPETKVIDPETGQEVPGTFDPAMRRVVNAQARAIKEARAALQKIEQERQAVQQQAVERRNQRDYAAFEKCIADDPSLKHVLGEGPAHRLVGTTAHEARQRLAAAADSLVAAGAARSIPESYEMAKRALFGDQIVKTAQTEAQRAVYEQARNAQGQFISRPSATERSDDLPKGPARALRTLERMLHERGAPA